MMLEGGRTVNGCVAACREMEGGKGPRKTEDREYFASARFHNLSLGWQFGLDKAMPEVKNRINAEQNAS